MIDGDKGILSCRGFPIEVSAERSTFEETAMLLLDGALPTRATLTAFDQNMRAKRRVKFWIREYSAHNPRVVILERWMRKFYVPLERR